MRKFTLLVVSASLLSGVATVQAHFCGLLDIQPPLATPITLAVGDRAKFFIIADILDESQESEYSIVNSTDTSKASVILTSATAFAFGEYIIKGLSPGQTTLTLSWEYEPTLQSDTCLVEVTVVDAATADPATASNFEQSGTSNDPVNTHTGELTMVEDPDLFLGGPLPLFFQRYYASGLLDDNLVLSSLGINWMHNFELSLLHIGNEIDIAFLGGRKIQFQLNMSEWELVGTSDIPFQLVASGPDFLLADPRTHIIYQFDSGGKLISIADRNGNALTLTYNNNLLTQVFDSLGRVLTFNYAGAQVLNSVSDGTRTIILGNIFGEHVAVIDAENKNTSYNFPFMPAIPGLLNSVQRPECNIPFTQTYDANGRVLTQADSDNDTFSFSYVGSETTIKDPETNTVVHTHDANGRLISVEDQTMATATFGYNADGQRTTITDRLNDTTMITYHSPSGRPASFTDAEGNNTQFAYQEQTHASGLKFHDLTQVMFPDGTDIQFTYDSAGNVLTATDQAEKTTTMTYNSRGQVLTVTNPTSGLTTFTYDEDAMDTDGNLATITDHFNNMTSFTYDALGRLTRTDLPGFTFQQYTYDNNDRLVNFTDERSKVTTFTYDDNGNRETATDPLNQVTNYAYDGNDRLMEIDGRRPGNADLRRYDYDSFGRLNSLTNQANENTAIGYDSRGFATTVTDPDGKTATNGFDAEGVLSSFTNRLNKTWNFQTDKLGRLVEVTSPLTHQQRFTYDPLGRVTEFQDSLAQITTFAYDERGSITRAVLPNEASTAYEYSDLGRLTKVTDPNGNDWAFNYNAKGQITLVNDPFLRSIVYGYDARSRIDEAFAPLGNVTFTYDDAGNLTQHNYTDGTIYDYAYDDANRLLTADGLTAAYDERGLLVESNGLNITRDVVGRIETITYAAGKTVTYTYDNRGLLSQVMDWVAGNPTTFTYDDAARLSTITRPNGVTTTYTYDDDGRLSGVSEDDSGGNLSSITLTRDGEGRITAANRNVPLGLNLSNSEELFTYDAAHQVSGGGFTYDLMGRATSDGARTYPWDLSNRLTSIDNSGNIAAHTYDGLGNLISRTEGGATLDFVLNYALGLPSLSVVRQSSTDLDYFIYTPGGLPLHCIEPNENREFYHFDEAGNALFISDNSGTITDRFAITPYGEIVQQTGSSDAPFTFGGAFGIVSVENNLYYMRKRFYNPTTAAFLSQDPVKSYTPRSVNPYQYAFGNPLLFVDANGLAPINSNRGPSALENNPPPSIRDLGLVFFAPLDPRRDIADRPEFHVPDRCLFETIDGSGSFNQICFGPTTFDVRYTYASISAIDVADPLGLVYFISFEGTSTLGDSSSFAISRSDFDSIQSGYRQNWNRVGGDSRRSSLYSIVIS